MIGSRLPLAWLTKQLHRCRWSACNSHAQHSGAQIMIACGRGVLRLVLWACAATWCGPRWDCVVLQLDYSPQRPSFSNMFRKKQNAGELRNRGVRSMADGSEYDTGGAKRSVALHAKSGCANTMHSVGGYCYDASPVAYSKYPTE